MSDLLHATLVLVSWLWVAKKHCPRLRLIGPEKPPYDVWHENWEAHWEWQRELIHAKWERRREERLEEHMALCDEITRLVAELTDTTRGRG